MELTSPGQVGGVRHQARNRVQTFGVPGRAGYGTEQSLGVRMMFLAGKYIFYGAVLHNLPCVHDGHAVTGLGNHAQVMGNQQHGGAEPFL